MPKNGPSASNRSTSKSASPATVETQERIAERAYAIWEQAGRPDDRAEEHWFRAEEEIRTEDENADHLRSHLGSTSPFPSRAR